MIQNINGVPTYVGESVAEATERRLCEVARQIEELQDERRRLQRRLGEYRHSTMMEAKRIATAAEPHQRDSLS